MTDKLVSNYLGAFSIKVDQRFNMERQLEELGVWEPDVVYAVNEFVQPGWTCVDIGANSGFHALAMAKAVGSNGKVYAFEPSSLTFPRLVDNVNLNTGLRGLVVPEKLALGESRGLVKLYNDNPENYGNTFLEQHGRQQTDPELLEEFELCLMMPLDGVLSVKVDFVKIDTEGMELAVLRGGATTFKNSKPVIYYETLLPEFDHERIKGCEALLHEWGYRLFRLQPEGNFREVVYPDYAINTLALSVEHIAQFGEKLLLSNS